MIVTECLSILQNLKQLISFIQLTYLSHYHLLIFDESHESDYSMKTDQ